MRRNGVLATPKKLSAAVLRFAMGALAASPEYQSAERARGPDSELGQAIRKDAKWFKKLHLRKKRLNRGSGYGATIEVSLSDLGTTYPIKKMEEFNPTIQLELITDKPRERSVLGSFSSYFSPRHTDLWQRHNVMMVSVNGITPSVLGFAVPSTIRQYEEIKREVQSTIQHEMRHFVQSALLDAVGFSRTDIPKADLKKRKSFGLKFKPPSRGGNTFTQYLLDQQEYFPWIGDWFVRLRAYTDHQDRPMVLKDFDRAVDTWDLRDKSIRSFRDTLKRYAPDRYRRLRVEQSAFLSDYNDARKARIHAEKRRLPLTAQRVVSEVLLDLDIVDPVLAAYTRHNRDALIAFAKKVL